MTKKEIKKRKKKDFNFVLAAVAPALQIHADRLYNDVLSNNGDQWLADKTISIVKEVMFDKRAYYYRYLESLKTAEKEYYFSDMYPQEYLDEYHISRALNLWEVEFEDAIDDTLDVERNALDRIKNELGDVHPDSKKKLIQELLNDL